MAQLRYKLIKDIFNEDKTLVRSLYDNFGITAPDWLSPQTYWYVVYYKKDWVAYGALRSHSAECAYSGPTLVRTEWRGRGIQIKLIKKRLRLAKKLGYIKVISSTFADNYPSNNNLIKCGFKMIPPWLVQEENSLYWEKLL